MKLASGVTYLRPLRGFICLASVYEYNGWRFEYKPYIGAWPLRKDGEPFKRCGIKSKFWKTIDEFLMLTEEEQRKYQVGGGCIPI